MTATGPSTGLVVGTLFMGLVASLFWPVTRYLITIAHEGTHAMTGSMTGGKVLYVQVNADATGETKASGNLFLYWIAGYVGPSLFGIAGAILLDNGAHPDAILWTTIVLLGAVVLQMRKFFGIAAVAVAGFFLIMIVRNATPTAREVCAYTLIWFLLFGGVIQNMEDNRKSVGWSGDGASLRDYTKIPKGFWGMLWWLATLAALGYGGGILVGAIDAPGT
ncbi:M50 family metallopeptidase [Phytohabitans sp. ZYX-F-186]|uniref:M50 family metallopeptidase n=1 Tax=Phytohabitans maris TaxID=3071409 RepID=A0ABU0ZKF3_9ACTN|nr:M50 family metallopeptidase [Phytohabitans sp. ZYX-F-186]MDQ7907011.1 M50 family metallopeptidase [Phytohabitans sp. ZYX-F-186]